MKNVIKLLKIASNITIIITCIIISIVAINFYETNKKPVIINSTGLSKTFELEGYEHIIDDKVYLRLPHSGDIIAVHFKYPIDYDKFNKLLKEYDE